MKTKAAPQSAMAFLSSRARRFTMQLKVKYSRTRLCTLSLIFGLACLSWWMWTPRSSEYDYHVPLVSKDFKIIRQSLPNQSGSESTRCVPPVLPLFNDFIRSNRPKPISPDLCVKSAKPNWLRVSQSRILFKPEFASASCSAEPVVRVDDHTSEFAGAQPIQHGSELPSVGFRATCRAPDGSTHTSVYYGIKRMQRAQKQQQQQQQHQDNIVIVGLDSLSRLESLRSLPRASRLVQSELSGVTLMQYNILGDGTPAALLPILTGVREEGMPEGRKGFKTARHVDESMRWIFQSLRDQGYVTLWGEEQSSFGTFQLRFLGFKNEPVDYYLRPVLQQQEPLQTDDICIGDEVCSARMLNAIRDLYYLHPNQSKFAFVFLSYLTHENKDLTPMDSELAAFFDWFVREDLIRNSSLIFMSDHGQRHGPMRNSMQGKLEESLPLMTIALSRQLTSHRTAALKLLQTNANRLSTPVDIHKTLLSIAGVLRDETKGDHDRPSSYSLIDEAVAESRTCSDAQVPTHWCSCLRLTKLSSPESQQLSLRAAQFVVSQMNQATQGFRHLCHELRLQNIFEADVSVASNDLAKRERYVNWRYAAYNVEDTTVVATGYLNIRVSTAPNTGMYEATVQYLLQDASGTQSLSLKLIGEASRTNRYGSQADCVLEPAPRLRKFCYCRVRRSL